MKIEDLTDEKKYCPYSLLTKYKKERGQPVNRNAPFFVFRDGVPVKAQQVCLILRKAINSINLDAKLYDTDSLHIGRVTDLFRNGVEVETIKKLGRWKSNSIAISQMNSWISIVLQGKSQL